MVCMIMLYMYIYKMKEPYHSKTHCISNILIFQCVNITFIIILYYYTSSPTLSMCQYYIHHYYYTVYPEILAVKKFGDSIYSKSVNIGGMLIWPRARQRKVGVAFYDT